MDEIEQKNGNIRNVYRALLFHPINFIQGWLYKKRHSVLSMHTDEYLEYFGHLFNRAASTNGINYLYTILRVEGITSGHWDAFVEAEEAAMDFSKMLRKIGKRHAKRALRMALFLYCHSTEMSVPYEVIANLLRCCMDQPYKMYPFAELVEMEKMKNSIFAKRHIPPPRKKINFIKKLATACGEERIGQIINDFFSNDVRNAFYHSDYAISDDEFRIIEGADLSSRNISLEKLSEMLSRCFAFYSAFFITYKQIRKGLASGNKFIRFPNYEVLEMLSDEEGLTGLKIHFPNGNHAMFERKKYKGTTGINLMCEEEGVVLNVGDLQAYESATDWMVDGKPFEQYGTRYNRSGHWYPIIFRRDSDLLQRRAIQATKDREVQDCLFYVYATGHKAIEFVIKSSTDLFSRNTYSLPRWSKKKKIVIEKIERTPQDAFIYDCTYYLNNDDSISIRSALDEINELLVLFRKKDNNLRSRLKYHSSGDPASMGQVKQEADGSFSIVLKMDDPRHMKVVSNLGMFPKSNWKIREDWI